MIVGWVLTGFQAFLAVAILVASGMKLTGHDRVVGEFERYGYSMGFMRVTGIIEGLGVVGLVVGFVRPVAALAGGAIVVAVMLGALFTHIRVQDPFSEFVPPTVLLVTSVAVTAGTAITTGLVPL